MHIDSAILAVGRFAEAGKVLEVKIDVIREHQIKETVAVVIPERSAGGPASVGNAGFGGHIGEGAVPVVVVKNVAAETGHVKIGPAVVVVVTDRSTHRKAGRGQAEFLLAITDLSSCLVVLK